MKVHRLLWMAWRGPIPDGYVMNHLDGVRDHNDLENLECVTQAENVWHAHRNGLAAQPNPVCGEDHGQAKLTNEDVIQIRAMRHRFTQAALGKMYGISRTQVGRIVRGERWQDAQPEQQQEAMLREVAIDRAPPG